MYTEKSCGVWAPPWEHGSAEGRQNARAQLAALVRPYDAKLAKVLASTRCDCAPEEHLEVQEMVALILLDQHSDDGLCWEMDWDIGLHLVQLPQGVSSDAGTSAQRD